jgi:hypothetical protein
MKNNDDRSTFAERVLLPIVIAAGMVVAYLDLFIWSPM